MARSSKRPRPAATFKHTTRIEVRRAEFKPLASVRHLDAARLSRAARAEIELGHFKTDCCGQLVKAIVKKGMVTELVVEPCSDEKAKAPSPELARVVEIARRRVAPPDPVKLPIPVADFLSDAVALTIRTITCVQICIWGFCFVCCTTHIPGVPIWCGDKVIIVRN
jgi:hypothetical protein